MKSALVVLAVMGLCACASTGTKVGAQISPAAMPAAPMAAVTMAPEGGYVAVAEERVYGSLKLAWDKAEMSAAHAPFRQQLSSFTGAVLRETAETPKLNGNSDLQIFLKDWGSTVEMQKCENPRLTYARLWDQTNNARWKEVGVDGKPYELVKVTLIIGPAQIASLKAFNADLASVLKHDAVTRHVLKQGQDDFFKVLKKVQGVAQASDSSTTADAEIGNSDEEESPQ